MQYDQYKTPMENIGLQDSLLSRFDLLFIVLDQMDPEQDREISDHVLRMHRYRNPNEQDGDGELLITAASLLRSPVLPWWVVTSWWQLFGFSIPGCFEDCFWWLLEVTPEAKSLFSLTLLSPAMPLGSAVEILATEDPDFVQEEEQELQVYEKHDDLLHGPNRRK